MKGWGAKRFWTQATVVKVTGGFGVHLDGRAVQTPAKQAFIAPTSALAHAAAAEWRAQGDTIKPETMPVTRAINAAIDKVTPQRPQVAALIAAYGDNDLLCYRATAPAALVAMQAQVWDPYLTWAAKHLGARLQTTQGVMPTPQPTPARAALQALVTAQGPFSLTALHDLTSLTGSLILGLAAQRHAFDAGVLWSAATVDEAFQMQEWGEDSEALEALAKKAEAFANAMTFQRLLDSADFTA